MEFRNDVSVWSLLASAVIWTWSGHFLLKPIRSTRYYGIRLAEIIGIATAFRSIIASMPATLLVLTPR